MRYARITAGAVRTASMPKLRTHWAPRWWSGVTLAGIWARSSTPAWHPRRPANVRRRPPWDPGGLHPRWTPHKRRFWVSTEALLPAPATTFTRRASTRKHAPRCFSEPITSPEAHGRRRPRTPNAQGGGRSQMRAHSLSSPPAVAVCSRSGCCSGFRRRPGC